MAKLKVTRADGRVQEFEISPILEYSFEKHMNKGFAKAIIEDQKNSDVYWLSWEAIRRSGETVTPFGDSFVETLKSVDILPSDPLG